MAEIRHYTKEQVEEHLRDALELTERLEPASDLRGHVFSHAAQMLSQKSIVQAAPPILGVGGRLQ